MDRELERFGIVMISVQPTSHVDRELERFGIVMISVQPTSHVDRELERLGIVMMYSLRAACFTGKQPVQTTKPTPAQ